MTIKIDNSVSIPVTDLRYLKLDQTTPQTIAGGIPLLTGLTPTLNYEIATKKYVDDNAGGAVEGTAVLSTGEAGGTKFLREDGDGTCSWQPAPAGGAVAIGDLTGMTAGYVPFGEAGGGGLAQDAGLFWDNTNKILGIGLTPDSSAKLQVEFTTALVDGSIHGGVKNTLNYNPASSSSDFATGFSNFANKTGSEAMTGTWGGGGLVGQLNIARNYGTGTVSNAYGTVQTIQSIGGGVLTNGYALFIPDAYVAGVGSSITNNIGLYIDPQTAGSSSNYAIYSAGGLNYFVGNITTYPTTNTGLGNAVARTTLHAGRDVQSDIVSIDYTKPTAIITGKTDGSSGGGTVLSAREPILVLHRTNEAGVVYGEQVNFEMKRWELSGSNSRTQLDIRLLDTSTTDGGFTDVLTLRSSGNVRLPLDYATGAAGCLSFGAAQDAEMGYDGTNLVVNPKVVGTGILDVQGVIQTDGYKSSDATAGATATKSGLVFKDGLYTSGGIETTIVVKASDETVNNSNVLQDDAELKFTMAASTKYRFELLLLMNAASNAADWKVGFTAPVACTMFWGTTGRDNAAPGAFTPKAVGTSAGALQDVSGSIVMGGANNTHGAIIWGVVTNGANAGDLQFQWAQNTATAEDNIILAGSHLIVTKLG